MLRIGHNQNTNMLPMFYFLSQGNPDLDWVIGQPTTHNKLLAEGKIDLAPISAFSYGEHWRDYAILPDLSVSTKGRVGSILLFTKYPLKELDGRKVALTSHSATSVNLLKIILKEFYHCMPEYVIMDAGLSEMMAEADAGLLIADQAIQASLSKPEAQIIDLGEEWFRQTGCPMTFSVWAYPKYLIHEKGEEIRNIHELLISGRNKALNHMDEIVNTCVQMLGATSDFWVDYFNQFSYTLDSELQRGLSRYFEYCVKYGQLEEQPEILIWPEDLGLRE
ncbi:menaquinone biosynthetic enzyme MqnA/MqnD family protein [Desulfitobacterium sp. Sab5]|uniref:menaquinone biosynthetic enzyme MqnA/MqnD family protein n=1 Tax=Desulfitobacterium nosdiversum TaxID=3375356 RepID=UPI003CEA171D